MEKFVAASKKIAWLFVLLGFWSLSIVSPAAVFLLAQSDSALANIASIPIGIISAICLVIGMIKWWRDEI